MTRCEKHDERLVPATMAAYRVIAIDLHTNKHEERIVPQHQFWVCLSCVVENDARPN